MKVTSYNIDTDKKGIDITVACVSDLHARPCKRIIDALKSISPDIILLAGDIFEIIAPYMESRNKNAMEFIKECVTIAPTFYTIGNHEIYNSHARIGLSKTPDKAMEEKHLNTLISLGVTLINDEYVKYSHGEEEILIGGAICGRDKDPSISKPDFNLDFIERFDTNENIFKILLCHYPHYYPQYLKNTSFDLILAGHAHGGQWRIFGRGVFAPHQGLFPKLTSGMHDGRLIISSGAVNNTKPIPRFFNPCEILKIKIKSK